MSIPELTGMMNIVARSVRQLFRAMGLYDLPLARRIYYRQILPFVEVMARNFNPTGTIKAGVCARGIDVGLPRKPGSGVSAADKAPLERLSADVKKAEDEIETTPDRAGRLMGKKRPKNPEVFDFDDHFRRLAIDHFDRPRVIRKARPDSREEIFDQLDRPRDLAGNRNRLVCPAHN